MCFVSQSFEIGTYFHVSAMYAVGANKFEFGRDELMNIREFRRVVGTLGVVLTFFVGIISTVLGITSSSPDQSGGSLVVRGLILVGLSIVAGYGISFGGRRPVVTSIYLTTVAVAGSVTALRSFWMAAAVLLIAAAFYYTSRDK